MSVDGFIPQIWTARLRAALHKALVFGRRSRPIDREAGEAVRESRRRRAALRPVIDRAAALAGAAMSRAAYCSRIVEPIPKKES